MSRHVMIGKARIERAVTKMVKSDDGRTVTRREVGTESGTVECWVDADWLLKLYASKALGSKGRKARVAHGAVMLKAVDIRSQP